MYFSEYIEGSSSNKALEIYNPTAQTIDLTGYKIYRYNNGASTPTDSLFLAGMLSSGDVYVAANSNADSAGIRIFADTLHSITFYNGDDAIELYNGTSLLDVIGIVGTDPGSLWSVDTGATREYTLVRKSAITRGTTTWTAVGDTQWIAYSQNDFSFIGSHTTIGCQASPLVASITVSDDTICLGTIISYNGIVSGGTAPYSATVNFGDGSSSATLTGTHTYATAGTYNLTFHVADDAIPSVEFDSLIVVSVDACSAIDEEKETAISIFPNPSKTGIINFSNVDVSSTITIYNVIGEVVFSAVTNGNQMLDLSSLNTGTYFVAIANNLKSVVTKKLIIE